MPSELPIATTGSTTTQVAARLNGWSNYRVNTQTVYVNNAQAATSAEVQPSFLQILMRLVLKRQKLFIAWCVVSAALAAAVIVAFGKPVWRAEGKLRHEPSYRKVFRSLTTPANIQSVLQMMKDPDMLEQVHSDLHLPGTPAGLKNLVKTEVLKSNEELTVTVDNPNKDEALAISNRMMEIAVLKNEKQRLAELEQALGAKQREKDRVTQERRELMLRYNAELRKNNVNGDLKLKIEDVDKEKSGAKTKLDDNQRILESLPQQIKEIESSIERLTEQAKNSPQQRQAIQQIEALIAEKRALLEINKVRLISATQDLETLKKLPKGAVPLSEFRAAEKEFTEADNTVKFTKQLLDRLEKDREKQLDLTDNNVLANPRAELLRLKNQQKTLQDNEIPGLKKKIDEFQRESDRLNKLKDTLFPLESEIETKQRTIDDLEKLISENQNLKDPSSQELKIAKAADVGKQPVSSNYPKLAAGVFAAMMLLFLGFVVAKDLPRYSLSGEVTARRLSLPVLANYDEAAPNMAIFDGSAPVSTAVRSLAEQLRIRFPERGSIILFTPSVPTLKIESLVGDLACFVSQTAGKVLVFDSRPLLNANSIPAWIGHDGIEVGQRVEDFLEGKTDKPATCFAPTQVSKVEYSRAQLSSYVNNMIGMYRFHRLVEEMRERFAMILLIAPAVNPELGDENYLQSLVDGSILVLDGQENPVRTHNYVDMLRASDAPLMGSIVFERRSGGW